MICYVPSAVHLCKGWFFSRIKEKCHVYHKNLRWVCLITSDKTIKNEWGKITLISPIILPPFVISTLNDHLFLNSYHLLIIFNINKWNVLKKKGPSLNYDKSTSDCSLNIALVTGICRRNLKKKHPIKYIFERFALYPLNRKYHREKTILKINPNLLIL